MAFMSARSRNLAIRIAQSEDQELICSDGQWWLDFGRVWPADAVDLLRWACLHDDTIGESERYRIYSLNEDGRALVLDPDHEPRLVEAWRQMISVKKQK